MRMDATVVRDVAVALEVSDRPHDRGQQLDAHPTLDSRPGEQGAAGDPRSETDDHRRPAVAFVQQERQQRLQPHVALRHDAVAGVRHAVDVEPSKRRLEPRLLDHGHRPAGALLVGHQRAEVAGDEPPGEMVARDA
jgi:hypothetical protein